MPFLSPTEKGLAFMKHPNQPTQSNFSAAILHSLLTKKVSQLPSSDQKLAQRAYSLWKDNERSFAGHDNEAFQLLCLSIGASEATAMFADVWEASCLSIDADLLAAPFVPKRKACSTPVPQPRLVGIELNPGPTPTSRAISAAASAIGAAVAKTVKKKKNIATTKKKKKGSSSSSSSRRSQGSAQGVVNNIMRQFETREAPASWGFMTRPNANHSPFVVAGTGIACTVTSNASSNIIVTNSLGVNCAANSNIFNVDPTGGGTLNYNMALFPVDIINVTKNFLRYRFRKLVMRWFNTCTSSTPGSIYACVYPEVVSFTTNVGFSSIAQSQVSIGSSVWNQFEFDLLAKGGLRKEWLYVDQAATNSEPQSRQESPGSFAMDITGYGPSITYGSFYLEFEIEYDGLARQDLLDFYKQNPQHAPSASSFSVAPTPVIEQEELADSVYLPSSTLSALGLRKAVPTH